MVLTAAVKVLLARYSGQHDIAIGTATSGRNRAELEQLIGCFVNTVILRSNVDSDVPFTALLSAVRETVLEAFAHDEAPFEQLVEDLQPVRDPSRTPLVQAMIVLQNAPSGERDLAGLRVADLAVDTGVANYDWIIEFE